jgi:hypothetical protein
VSGNVRLCIILSKQKTTNEKAHYAGIDTGFRAHPADELMQQGRLFAQ